MEGIDEQVTDIVYRIEQVEGDEIRTARKETAAIHAEATPAAIAEPRQAAGGPGEMPGDTRSSQPVEPIRNMGQKVGRNAPSPCGSGKKFKNCCAKSSGVPLG